MSLVAMVQTLSKMRRKSRKIAVQQPGDESVSLAIFARQAVDTYLADVLRGESPWEDAESIERSFAFEADAALAELLSRAVVEAEEDTAEDTFWTGSGMQSGWVRIEPSISLGRNH